MAEPLIDKGSAFLIWLNAQTDWLLHILCFVLEIIRLFTHLGFIVVKIEAS